jgi:hypothetical protein
LNFILQTEEAMDSDDSRHDESMETFSVADAAVPEEYKCVSENVIIVSNALDPKPMAIFQLSYEEESNLLAVAKFAKRYN